ncbi:hypothetical protein [Geobacter metallireducens]|uniref:hypothetical protein n=1 Tax=Geobacter metallireducens TaxID=28232 RepID=UPI000316ADC6|nr:hypothetical protein [Geobacter metallireducens]
MTDLSLAQAQRVVLLLAGTVKGYSLYPEAHPAIAQPLRETCTILEQILRGRNDVRLGIHDGVLFLEQHLFFTPTASVDELAGILTAREIRAVTFLRGLVPDELAALVALLSRRELTGGGLAAELARRGGGPRGSGAGRAPAGGGGGVRSLGHLPAGYHRRQRTL